jgi:hypothetical protein
MFSMPAKVIAELVTPAGVLVPEILKTNVSPVPAPPLRLSPGLKVVPFAVNPFVPITPLNVSLPAVPVNAVPESAPVVSDLIIVFDILLILNNFLSILLDIKCIAYDVPIFNSKSR